MKGTLIAFVMSMAVFAVSAQEVDMTGFVFPDFRHGEVVKKNGANIAGPLNYDAIFQKMTYMDRSGNFFYLGEAKDISLVTVGNRVFVPSGVGDAFLEEIKVEGGKMYIQYRVEYQSGESSSTPYGSSQTTAAQSLGYLSVSGGSGAMQGINSGRFEMSKRGEVKERTQYGIMDNGKFKVVNSARSLVSVFGHKDEIGAFVKNNAIKFDNFEDVKRVVEYGYSMKD